jgi:pimeloyl-ACP methyl ester carboxylesterase
MSSRLLFATSVSLFLLFPGALHAAGPVVSHGQIWFTFPDGAQTLYRNGEAVYTVEPGSADFPTSLYRERLPMPDGQPVGAGLGLVVWTMHRAERAVYSIGGQAVTIQEHPDTPQPVDYGAAGGGRLYVQFMDASEWNATYSGYAYEYVVYTPQCAGPLPVVLYLHQRGGYELRRSGPPADWCAYTIAPLDVGNTWWYGYARDFDYWEPGQPVRGDVVENYTERRVIRMVSDLLAHPPAQPADRERVYVYGHSMGASGALAMALRYPDIFAAAYASEPMTNYAANVRFRDELVRLWGSVADDLGGVWDWQNHQSTMRNKGLRMSPLGMAQGTQDAVMDWATQGAPMAGIVADLPVGYATVAAAHVPLFWAGLPAALGLVNGVPFLGLTVRVKHWLFMPIIAR